jgi:hypothetical protein
MGGSAPERFSAVPPLEPTEAIRSRGGRARPGQYVGPVRRNPSAAVRRARPTTRGTLGGSDSRGTRRRSLERVDRRSFPDLGGQYRGFGEGLRGASPVVGRAVPIAERSADTIGRVRRSTAAVRRRVLHWSWVSPSLPRHFTSALPRAEPVASLSHLPRNP